MNVEPSTGAASGEASDQAARDIDRSATAAATHRPAVGAELRLAGVTVTAATHDLGHHGVELLLDRSVEEGTEVALTLYRIVDGVEDEQAPVARVQGRVSWSAPRDEGGFHVGVRFHRVDGEHHSWIEGALG
jgi:hypothetical protein